MKNKTSYELTDIQAGRKLHSSLIQLSVKSNVEYSSRKLHYHRFNEKTILAFKQI